MRLLADDNFPLPTVEALRQAPQRSGVILFRVHPAVPENITPLVLRTVAAESEWPGHATVVTSERVLMVRLGGRESRH